MIRISAVRSVFGFCDHLKTSNNTQLLVPFLSNILDGLITIATQFSAEVLGLCIETLTVVISVSVLMICYFVKCLTEFMVQRVFLVV